MDGFIHAHPLLAVAAFTWLVLVVFAWALFDGSSTAQVEDIQQGGDWAWPPREEL